ncbi:MAG: ATP synthase F1 subunit delta [Ferruginibacter sp.]
MNNPRLAGRYAKSLLDLAKERGQVEEVYADMKVLKALFVSNRDVVALVKSPIINADKKDKILKAILKDRISPLTQLFIDLLVKKNRENNLPEMTNTFIDQYNVLKNIHRVKISTAVPLSSELREVFIQKIKSATSIQNIEMETIVDQALIGGFKLEMDGTLIDVTVLRDLNDVKKQFADNEYIHKLR